MLLVKNLLAIAEARDMGQEGPLEKEMATHSSILAWGIHFWGHVHISVSVYERERERDGNYSRILGEAGHRFIRLSRVL